MGIFLFFLHSVSGDWDRHGGAGIHFSAKGDAPDGSTRRSCFDGLRVEDCFFHDVSFYGILVSGWENRFRGDGWFPSTGVVIRNNGNGYLLLCSPDQSVPGTEGIVVRYHLSVNDGTTPKNGIFNPLPASFHRDPAERLIVASARVKGLALATHDRKLQYACSLPIWKGVSSCNFGF
ncbi:MAG: hypothetical protein ACO3N7_04885 [Kiritimatiellia bacterium]